MAKPKDRQWRKQNPDALRYWDSFRDWLQEVSDGILAEPLAGALESAATNLSADEFKTVFSTHAVQAVLDLQNLDGLFKVAEKVDGDFHRARPEIEKAFDRVFNVHFPPLDDYLSRPAWTLDEGLLISHGIEPRHSPLYYEVAPRDFLWRPMPDWVDTLNRTETEELRRRGSFILGAVAAGDLEGFRHEHTIAFKPRPFVQLLASGEFDIWEPVRTLLADVQDKSQPSGLPKKRERADEAHAADISNVTSWRDVTMMFKSGDDNTVFVSAGRTRGEYSFSQLGFEHKTKGIKVKSWELLQRLAKKGGFVSRQGLSGKALITQENRVRDLNERLKRRFRLTDNPVVLAEGEFGEIGWLAGFDIHVE